jgi:hypothetical protein
MKNIGKRIKTHFADKLIRACDASHYDFDGLGSLRATVRSNSSYLQSSLSFRTKINI